MVELVLVTVVLLAEVGVGDPRARPLPNTPVTEGDLLCRPAPISLPSFLLFDVRPTIEILNIQLRLFVDNVYSPSSHRCSEPTFNVSNWLAKHIFIYLFIYFIFFV